MGVRHDFSVAQSLYLLHFSGTAMLVKRTAIPRSSGLMGRGVVWITRESVVQVTYSKWSFNADVKLLTAEILYVTVYNNNNNNNNNNGGINKCKPTEPSPTINQIS
jgi:hypothetical protein